MLKTLEYEKLRGKFGIAILIVIIIEDFCLYLRPLKYLCCLDMRLEGVCVFHRVGPTFVGFFNL